MNLENTAVEQKILIVEADAATVALELELLQKEGHTLKHAANEADALAAIKEWRPALVILDMAVPGIDSARFFAEVGKIHEFSRPDIVATSALDAPESVYAALGSGALDFIRKPFLPREFSLRINALVQKRQHNKNTETNLRRLSRYFSPETSLGILEGRIADTLSGEMTPSSVMFFDLRNSTGLGEMMVPGLFFQFLTSFFGIISDTVYNFGGSINRYTGDGFLATFGLADYSVAASQRAVACALELRKQIALYNTRRPPYLKSEVGYGIGVTTGDVYAGNVGSIHKLEYTVFGDAVNLAARLESMTKNAKVDILLDEKTRAICGERLQVKKMQTTSVRGKTESVTMYYPEHFTAP